MDIFDECDTEYAVKTDISNNAKFYERGEIISNSTWGLTVIRKLMNTSKTIRALRKKGLISRWETFAALCNLPKYATILSTALCVVGISPAILFLIILANPTLSFLYIPTLSFIALFSVLSWVFLVTVYKEENFADKFFEKIHKKLKTNSERRIELPWKEQELYEFTKNLSKKTDQDEIKKTLFELLSEYPTEVNDRINELFKIKEENLEQSTKSTMFSSDIDGMLDKLFDMRDTPETAKIVEQVKQTLNDAINKEEMEKASVSVEKLSKIANFVNNSEEERKVSKLVKDNAEILTVLSAMNNVAPEYEIVEKEQWAEANRTGV